MKIRYGLKNLKWAPATSDEVGALTYGSYNDIKGAKSLTLNPVGEKVEEYADDVEWFTEELDDGYDGSFMVEETPKEFLKECCGFEEDSAGVLFENVNIPKKEFALAGEFTNKGDATVTGKRFCLLRCIASRPNVEGGTKEKNITVAHDTIGIRVLPRINDGRVKASADSTSAKYSTWFNSVISPTTSS